MKFMHYDFKTSWRCSTVQIVVLGDYFRQVKLLVGHKTI